MQEGDSTRSVGASLRLRGWRPIWLAAVTMAVVVAILWVSTDRGPRFAGRPASYWFPRIVWGGGSGVLDTLRLEQLRSGGAGALPMLLEAARDHE